MPVAAISGPSVSESGLWIAKRIMFATQTFSAGASTANPGRLPLPGGSFEKFLRWNVCEWFNPKYAYSAGVMAGSSVSFR